MIAWMPFARASTTLVCALSLATLSVAQEVPVKLLPPTGATALGTYAAKGVQIYVCASNGTANEWMFKAPEAQLVDAAGMVFAKHYAGPTWEATDGSKIVGKVMATVPAPTAGAIPWLLLSTTSSGDGVLSGARFVQRIRTVGGAGPIGTCLTPGVEQSIRYEAEYVIYK